jgi:hypothetical protein
VTELERQLIALGRELDVPPTPELAASVRARIGAPRRRRRPRGRTVVLAFAALAAGLGVAFAVPPARSAILRFFGVGGIRIERVDRLPPVRGRPELDLGRRVTLAEARRMADFRVRAPSVAGYDEPDAIYVSDRIPGALVSFLYGTLDEPRALLSELRSGQIYIEKTIGPGTKLERVTVNGSQGYRLTGRPHLFTFVNANGQIQTGAYRLSTTTLVWRSGGVTFRLEGPLSKEDAIAVAESVR